jgi:hypothetical protein
MTYISAFWFSPVAERMPPEHFVNAPCRIALWGFLKRKNSMHKPLIARGFTFPERTMARVVLALLNALEWVLRNPPAASARSH